MNKAFTQGALAAACLALCAPALSQVKIGVTVSATGPAASLGIPEKNTVAMCPKNAGGKTIE
jgi:branched-chain amino acid transport system substrate-binding protein